MFSVRRLVLSLGSLALLSGDVYAFGQKGLGGSGLPPKNDIVVEKPTTNKTPVIPDFKVIKVASKSKK